MSETLTATTETPGADYRYRAWINRNDLATGMSQIAQNLDYDNFKNEVAHHDPDRAHLYSHVWGVLGQLSSAVSFGPASAA